jgi:hypothetical protein
MREEGDKSDKQKRGEVDIVPNLKVPKAVPSEVARLSICLSIRPDQKPETNNNHGRRRRSERALPCKRFVTKHESEALQDHNIATKHHTVHSYK